MWLHPDCNAHTSPASQRRQQRPKLVLSQAARPRQRLAGRRALCQRPVPTPRPGLSTVRTGSKKTVWWHISTHDNQRSNWQNLANAFVQDHPDVSIEVTVLENEAFKSRLATAMQSGSPPDLFQSCGGSLLKQDADAGLVQDLTPARNNVTTARLGTS
jgi:ABC-type glycerol-3-phosphate transport system substrate-binding protein